MLKINKDCKVTKAKFDWDIDYMPEPGMLGTERCGTDRYSVICVSVNTPKRITIARLFDLDEEKIKNNPDIYEDEQGVMYMNGDDWKKYTPDKLEDWSLRKDNKWRQMNKNFSGSIHWGIANPYQDPNF